MIHTDAGADPVGVASHGVIMIMNLKYTVLIGLSSS